MGIENLIRALRSRAIRVHRSSVDATVARAQTFLRQYAPPPYQEQPADGAAGARFLS